MCATVVGICGGSGSGKTTLARTMRDLLGPARVAMLAFDSYYRDLSHLDPNERALVNFDHPDSLDVEQFVADISALAQGTAIEVPVYDFATHTRATRSVPTEPRPIIIAEGILLLAFPELVTLFDHAVFLDVPTTVRFTRRVTRDVRERGREPADVKRQFEDSVRPMHDRYVQPSAARAHQVISYGPDIHECASLVAGEVHPLVASDPTRPDQHL